MLACDPTLVLQVPPSDIPPDSAVMKAAPAEKAEEVQEEPSRQASVPSERGGWMADWQAGGAESREQQRRH